VVGRDNQNLQQGRTRHDKRHQSSDRSGWAAGGLPKRSDWQFTEAPIAEPRDGEVLTRVLYLSLDPAMRGWMNERKILYRAGRHRRHAHRRGRQNRWDMSGGFGVQECAALDGAQLTKIDPRLEPLPPFLNTFGMPGMTAYFGMLDVADPKEGDTVVVSVTSGETVLNS
jgi:NADPH-dependent curcumin reductase